MKQKSKAGTKIQKEYGHGMQRSGSDKRAFKRMKCFYN
jgi:hypothetical protein